MIEEYSISDYNITRKIIASGAIQLVLRLLKLDSAQFAVPMNCSKYKRNQKKKRGEENGIKRRIKSNQRRRN